MCIVHKLISIFPHSSSSQYPTFRLNFDLHIIQVVYLFDVLYMDLPTASIPDTCLSLLSYEGSSVIAIITSVLCILFAIYNWTLMRRIDLTAEPQPQQGEEELIDNMPTQKRNLLLQLGYKVSDATIQFLKFQYLSALLLVLLGFLLIAFLTELQFGTAVAFLVGSIVEVLSGAIAVIISVKSIHRVAYCSRFGLAPAFRTAMQASTACGFFGPSLSLLTLTVMIDLYKQDYSLTSYDTNISYYRKLFESIAGYGLGVSSVALFARVGGGMFEVAAQCGAELVGKENNSLPANHPKNAATIALMGGVSVGLGCGALSDSMGSVGQISCVVFLVSFDTVVGKGGCGVSLSVMMLPIILLTFGQFVGLVACIYSNMVAFPDSPQDIQKLFYIQRGIVWILMLGLLFLGFYLILPETFYLIGLSSEELTPIDAWLCGLIGTTAITLMNFFTQFVTSARFQPVQALTQASAAGGAAAVTLGLALGYFSTIFPGIIVSLAVFISHQQLGSFGISICALSSVSLLPLYATLQLFGPISLNAQTFSKVADLNQTERENTKLLAEIGKNSIAVDKGASITTASIIGISLLSAYLKNASLPSNQVSLTNPQIFTGLLIGSVFPFVVSALSIKGARKGGKKIKIQIIRQFLQSPEIERGEQQPDYSTCIRQIAYSVVQHLLIIIFLVIVAPLVIGLGLGPKFIAGLIPGIIVSSLQFSQASSISGEAWSSVKSSIQSGTVTDEQGVVQGIGSNSHKASLVAHTVAGGFRGSAGSALTAAVKLVGMLSVVFASKFTELHS